jgi:hypothetical protein
MLFLIIITWRELFTVWFNLKRYNEIQVSISIIDMKKDESPITFLKYKNLSDMLKVILFSSQSALGLTPMLYHLKYKEKEILFIETGALGGALVHYIVEKEKPNKKFIELRQLTGEHNFVEKIGNDTHSIYIPILELDSTSIEFPL